MSIFKRLPSPEELQSMIPDIVKYSGLEDLHLEQDSGHLSAVLTVAANNQQPHGILHGGVSCMIAETLGSIGANLCLPQGFVAVGQGLHASHLRSAPLGQGLKVIAAPIHLGRSSQVWNIQITEQKSDKLVCQVSLTLAVIARDRLRQS